MEIKIFLTELKMTDKTKVVSSLLTDSDPIVNIDEAKKLIVKHKDIIINLAGDDAQSQERVRNFINFIHNDKLSDVPRDFLTFIPEVIANFLHIGIPEILFIIGFAILMMVHHVYFAHMRNLTKYKRILVDLGVFIPYLLIHCMLYWDSKTITPAVHLQFFLAGLIIIIVPRLIMIIMKYHIPWIKKAIFGSPKDQESVNHQWETIKERSYFIVAICAAIILTVSIAMFLYSTKNSSIIGHESIDYTSIFRKRCFTGIFLLGLGVVMYLFSERKIASSKAKYENKLESELHEAEEKESLIKMNTYLVLFLGSILFAYCFVSLLLSIENTRFITDMKTLGLGISEIIKSPHLIWELIKEVVAMPFNAIGGFFSSLFSSRNTYIPTSI
ncbi:hypothetical protein NEFER03_2256 [Nematocida sp. LUAm3]|nr:hypothetical protein NEFER03_2256 [Nematocida sp. LUAm3]KAI5175859.1 hypothetical protein NEFER02_1728 [Nematocida sp. LUAm2]KAI5179405.1 hypothetical protein NEFER01_2229 [Nematocida sp. LUAm1]